MDGLGRSMGRGLPGGPFDGFPGGLDVLPGAFDRVAGVQAASREDQERAEQQGHDGGRALHLFNDSNKFNVL